MLNKNYCCVLLWVDLFWFYLHHVANGTLNLNEQAAEQTDASEDLAMFTNPKIRQFARDVFVMQLLLGAQGIVAGVTLLESKAELWAGRTVAEGAQRT